MQSPRGRGRVSGSTRAAGRGPHSASVARHGHGRSGSRGTRSRARPDRSGHACLRRCRSGRGSAGSPEHGNDRGRLCGEAQDGEELQPTGCHGRVIGRAVRPLKGAARTPFAGRRDALEILIVATAHANRLPLYTRNPGGLHRSRRPRARRFRVTDAAGAESDSGDEDSGSAVHARASDDHQGVDRIKSVQRTGRKCSRASAATPLHGSIPMCTLRSRPPRRISAPRVLIRARWPGFTIRPSFLLSTWIRPPGLGYS